MKIYISKKVMFNLALALFLICAAPSAFSQNSTPQNKVIDEISPSKAAELMERHQGDARFFILDVRTLAEYQQGYISGAKLLDSASPYLDEDLAKLERNAMYIVYCRSGRRSLDVAEKMEKLGFFHVYDLEGGILQWTKQGFALEK